MIIYDKKKLGKYLKACRKRANLTQVEVTTALGYSSAQFLSNIERGVAVTPLKTLANIARIYEIDTRVIERIILSAQKDLILRKLKVAV